MASIKDLKKKIKSTKGTLKITMAMKLVSASKLAKAQAAIVNSRPYTLDLGETIQTVSALSRSYSHSYLEDKKNNRAVLLVISSDRGLCGGYNSQLAKKIRLFMEETDLELKVYFIGKRVRDLIHDQVNEGKLFEFGKAQATFADIQKVAKELGSQFESGEVGHIYVAYNVFKSAMNYIPTVKELLPMTLDETDKKLLRERYPFDFKYVPSSRDILDTLIPETYINELFTCMLDAMAAEHGARMTSMDAATNNCKDAIRTLTLKMNKLRQAAITKELIEVVSGAESLKG